MPLRRPPPPPKLMARALTRTHFHSSRLLRILSDLACLEAAPAAAFAEKLGLWVDYTDAITLCAVHNARPASTPAPAPMATAAEAVAEEFARQRGVLERAIHTGKLPPMEPAEAAQLASSNTGAGPTAGEITAAYEPFRRYYLAQQRDLELKLPPLRACVREALAQASAALQQLGALDAALDAILAERESHLLGSLPLLLKKRFTHLLKHQHPQPPGAWAARFGQELQTVLLAELDLRLQTATGLIEALTSETTTLCTV